MVLFSHFLATLLLDLLTALRTALRVQYYYSYIVIYIYIYIVFFGVRVACVRKIDKPYRCGNRRRVQEVYNTSESFEGTRHCLRLPVLGYITKFWRFVSFN